VGVGTGVGVGLGVGAEVGVGVEPPPPTGVGVGATVGVGVFVPGEDEGFGVDTEAAGLWLPEPATGATEPPLTPPAGAGVPAVTAPDPTLLCAATLGSDEFGKAVPTTPNPAICVPGGTNTNPTNKISTTDVAKIIKDKLTNPFSLMTF